MHICCRDCHHRHHYIGRVLKLCQLGWRVYLRSFIRWFLHACVRVCVHACMRACVHLLEHTTYTLSQTARVLTTN